MGERSTPPTAGIAFLVGLSSGSVGRYAINHGIWLSLISGYHDMTIRAMRAIDINEKNGPKKASIGAAKVSASRAIEYTLPSTLDVDADAPV